MKILVFSPYYPPHAGGLETHADEFNKYLSKKGVYITVFTPRLPQNAKEFEMIHNNVQIIRFPAFEIIPNYPLPKFWKIKSWKMLKEVFSNKFDIVISRTRFFATTSFLAFFYAKTYKSKWVHIEHGSDFVKLNSKLNSSIARLYDFTLGRAVIAFADKVVANSKASAAFCQKLHQRNCQVIYRGVEMEKIQNQISNSELKSAYKDKLIVTFIGRLIDGKGVSDLLRALSKIENDDLVVFIIGDGPQYQNLEKLSGHLEINNKVVFFGHKNFSETIALLKISDIFVNPSYTEGLPTSVIEAALCKKAIIATNVGGTPEIITNNKSGLLVNPKNIPDLTEKLNFLIENPKIREQLGNNAFTEVENKFNWDHSIEKYLKLFKELI